VLRFGDDEIIGYGHMCDREDALLQRGISYRLNPSHSVVLTSVRSSTPYDGEIQDDGQVLVHKGQDAPKCASNPTSKLITSRRCARHVLKKSDKLL
jgi:hypothetical protein